MGVMASGDEKPTSAPAPADGGSGNNNKGPGRPNKKNGNAGRQRGNGKVDQGRAAWNRNEDKKRHRDDVWRSRKRTKVNDDGETIATDAANQFSKEEIEAEKAEGRRPKRKVAVLIGYSGTGYKGMQVNGDEATIERDLFRAFVAAGAISKANADDPKKSALVRCARTDKGVHAAGNVISLKLIIEDEDIIEKINNALPEQIRIWGIQRTMNSFSCYQMCDSRWYEYLMPAYSLLPPHPDTYLGKNIAELAKEYNGVEELNQRQEDVKDFWSEVEEKEVKPILEKLELKVRAEVLERLHAGDDGFHADFEKVEEKSDKEAAETSETKAEDESSTEAAAKPKKRQPTEVDFALRDIKAAYVAAKRRYRVSESRLNRLQEALSKYEGSHIFHNYTVQKSATDPSARRHIKSFVVDPNPIVIGNTQWLSLKVHGQSFMMHQIRKMVGLATLLVRCGSSLDRIPESYTKARMAIPKAPGLGLLLERPVFEMYNRKADGHGKSPIDFAEHEERMKAFKDKHIYQRIFEVEEEENFFYSFFNQIDQFKMNHFLWVTAGGLKVAQLDQGAAEKVDKQLDDEDEEDPEGGEG